MGSARPEDAECRMKVVAGGAESTPTPPAEALATPLPRAPVARVGDSARPVVLLMQQFLDGDAGATDWFRRGFLRWLKDDGGTLSMPAAMGLPTRPFLARIALRNLWLVAAAEHVEAPSLWKRARRLHGAVDLFVGTRWPTWRRMQEPPWQRARPVELCVYLAATATNGRFPETDRQFFGILCDAETADDFTPRVQTLP